MDHGDHEDRHQHEVDEGVHAGGGSTRVPARRARAVGLVGRQPGRIADDLIHSHSRIPGGKMSRSISRPRSTLQFWLLLPLLVILAALMLIAPQVKSSAAQTGPAWEPWQRLEGVVDVGAR